MECYEDVHSGAELRSVTDAVARFNKYPMEKIDQTEMWCVSPLPPPPASPPPEAVTRAPMGPPDRARPTRRCIDSASP